MSYTPTEWSKGDVITSEKLNKIEQGITNSCEGKIAIVSLSATGFNNATRDFCKIVYATLEDESWVVIIDNEDEWNSIWGYDEPFYRVLPPMIVPINSTLYPFIIPCLNDIEINTTGQIDSTAERLYFSNGSLVPGEGGYRISGSGSIEFVAL